MAGVIPVVVAGSYHVRRLWRGISAGPRGNLATKTPNRSASLAAGSADSKHFAYVDQATQTFVEPTATAATQTDSPSSAIYETTATQTEAAHVETDSQVQPESSAGINQMDVGSEVLVPLASQHEFEDFETSEETGVPQYVIFQGEDETDYVSGPIRIVDASDGIERGSALLLNLDLSAKIQDALRAEKEFNALEASADEERMRLRKLQSQIKSKMNVCSYRIAVAEEQHPENSGEIQSIGAELENLRLFTEDVKDREKMIEVKLRDRAQGLRVYQARVNAYLEEAFVEANLIQSEQEEPMALEPYDLMAEYDDFCSRQEEAEDSTFERVELTINDQEILRRDPDEISPQEKERFEAKALVYETKSALKTAEAVFDRRQDDRDAEEQFTEETPEEFDIRWFQRGNRLTRALIEAQEAYDQARCHAIAIGAELDGSDVQSSNFEDRSDDGYRESFEKEAIATVDMSKVTKWLDNVPDSTGEGPEGAEMVEQGDEWPFKEVDMSDSQSVVNHVPKDRKLIQKWRQIRYQ